MSKFDFSKLTKEEVDEVTLICEYWLEEGYVEDVAHEDIGFLLEVIYKLLAKE